jgi:hypothetical protein
MLVKNKIRDNQKERKLNFRWKESQMLMSKTEHDLNAWVKSLYEVRKLTRYYINDFRSWIERKTNEEWSIIQLINEFSTKKHRKISKNEKNQLMIIVNTNDEIDSFRAFLTFEVQKEAMIFVD